MKLSKVLGRVCGGAAVVFAGLLALALAVFAVVDAYRANIDPYLGTQSSVLLTDGDTKNADLYPFKPKKDDAKGIDCTNTDGLIAYMKDVSKRLAREGTVLLHNDGNILPLETGQQKVALIGSVTNLPFYGGSTSGSVTDESQAISLKDALVNKGFTVNQTIYDAYDRVREVTGTRNHPSGAVLNIYGNAAGNSTPNGKYTLNETVPNENGGIVSFSVDESWKNDTTAIVMIGRPNSEGSYYLPGTEGQGDTEEWDDGTDVLGLAKDEKANIAFAKANFKNVIILINSDSAMDIPELVDGEYKPDALLWVGHPGPFGFEGIAEILKGDYAPSGRLPDTYAVKASNSAAMANYVGYEFDRSRSASGIRWQDNGTYRGNANLWYLAETEGIYTGYKYYETRYYDSLTRDAEAKATSAKGATNGSSWNYADEMVYSFGYGISYTEFKETLKDVVFDMTDQTVTASVHVENIGDYAGKHVVQLYMQAPYTAGGLEKSAIQLAGYEKTETLQPGEDVDVTVTVDFDDIASYDVTLAHDGVKGGWVLEAGDYYFATGNGAHDALNNVLAKQGYTTGIVGQQRAELAVMKTVSRVEITESHDTLIQNRLQDIDPVAVFGDQGVKALSRADWETTWPKEGGWSGLYATENMVDGLNNQVYQYNNNDNNGKTVKWNQNHGLTFADLKPADALELADDWQTSASGKVGRKEIVSFDDEQLQKLVEQVTLEEAIRTVCGAQFRTIADIESINLRAPYWDDGASGFDSSKLNNQRAAATPDFLYRAVDDEKWSNYTVRPLPTEGLIGATFNHKLVQEAGEMIGNIGIWVGTSAIHVGANLHRTPYNGRNHEYYSEDPVLMGNMVYDYCVGGSRYGMNMAPKHYALNDTEWNRNGLAVFMSEQRAREAELRCFQKAFAKNATLYTMTAFNRAGAEWCSAHNGLMRGILRGEWGWNGYVMTDVAGNMYANSRDGIAASSDGILGFSTEVPNDNETGTAPSVTVDDVKDDIYFQQCLQESVKRLCYYLLNSHHINGPEVYSQRLYPWYDVLLITVEIISAILMSLAVVGYVVSLILHKKSM